LQEEGRGRSPFGRREKRTSAFTEGRGKISKGKKVFVFPRRENLGSLTSLKKKEKGTKKKSSGAFWSGRKEKNGKLSRQ